MKMLSNVMIVIDDSKPLKKCQHVKYRYVMDNGKTLKKCQHTNYCNLFAFALFDLIVLAACMFSLKSATSFIQ
jgi:hypothetical protein